MSTRSARIRRGTDQPVFLPHPVDNRYRETGAWHRK